MNENKTSTKVLQFFNVVVTVAVIVVNGLATALPLNGRATGEISDALPSYFTPAGYTFSIWGVIYLALIGYSVYQALGSSRKRPFLSQIGWLYAVSGVFNIAWIFAWHYGQYVLSVAMMTGLLVTLIVIFSRLGVGLPNVTIRWTTKLFVHIPFSLYLGWITVATIANVASVANYLGWNGFGIAEPVWSAIMMGVAVIVAGLLVWNRQAIAYAAVLVWALFGIRAAYTDVAIIANTAVVAAAIIAILALGGAWRTRQQYPEMLRAKTA